jgi:hypothetical protein
MTSVTPEKTAKELIVPFNNSSKFTNNQGSDALNDQLPHPLEKAPISAAWQMNYSANNNNVQTTRSAADIFPMLAKIHKRKREINEQMQIMVALSNSEKRRRILTEELNNTIAERNYVVNYIKKNNATPQGMFAGLSNLTSAHNLQAPIIMASIRRQIQYLHSCRFLQQERESRVMNGRPFVGPIDLRRHNHYRPRTSTETSAIIKAAVDALANANSL